MQNKCEKLKEKRKKKKRDIKSLDDRETVTFSLKAACKSFRKDKSLLFDSVKERKVFSTSTPYVYDELLQLCFNDLEEDIAACSLPISYFEAALGKDSMLHIVVFLIR